MMKTIVELTYFALRRVKDGQNKGEQQYFFRSADLQHRFCFNANKAKAWTWEIKGRGTTTEQVHKIIQQFCARQFKVAIGEQFTVEVKS